MHCIDRVRSSMGTETFPRRLYRNFSLSYFSLASTNPTSLLFLSHVPFSISDFFLILAGRNPSLPCFYEFFPSDFPSIHSCLQRAHLLSVPYINSFLFDFISVPTIAYSCCFFPILEKCGNVLGSTTVVRPKSTPSLSG